MTVMTCLAMITTAGGRPIAPSSFIIQSGAKSDYLGGGRLLLD